MPQKTLPVSQSQVIGLHRSTNCRTNASGLRAPRLDAESCLQMTIPSFRIGRHFKYGF